MTGLRDPRQAKSGTKFIHPQHYSHFHLDQKEHDSTTNNESSSVLYASVHPLEVGNFDAMVLAVEKLFLNDSGLNVQKLLQIITIIVHQPKVPYTIHYFIPKKTTKE